MQDDDALLGQRPPGEAALFTLTFNIVPDSEFEPAYANIVEVSRGQFEYELRFARVPAKPSREQMEAGQRGEPVELPTVARVMLPLSVMTDLIAVLERSKTPVEASDG